jgi:hypothetical protein
MFRGLLDLINVLMLWGFAYVVSIMILIVAIVHLTNENNNHQHRIIEINEPIKTKEEVCLRFDGCPIVNNVCVDCVVLEDFHTN